ncbi:MAG: phosphatidate cytidylyltransferase [Flavobacteriales bacterium]|nr:phosphatidate cytidylyltransferase [Flavobacteriales bacterium]
MDSDLSKRLLTGVLFLAVMLFGILFSEVSLLILFAVIVLLGSHEFARINGLRFEWIYALLNTTGFLLLYFQEYISLSILLILLIALSVLANSHKKKGFSMAMHLLGFILLPLAFALLANPEFAQANRTGILLFFILLWTNDSMAYVSGRTIGRHKLWERISPKKTWEGFFGGVISALALAWIIEGYFYFSLMDSLAIAFIVGVFGTLGDLLESSLKRNARVKDSGSLLPGHGGILDRFDGVMLSAPLVYLYMTWISSG